MVKFSFCLCFLYCVQCYICEIFTCLGVCGRSKPLSYGLPLRLVAAVCTFGTHKAFLTVLYQTAAVLLPFWYAQTFSGRFIPNGCGFASVLVRTDLFRLFYAKRRHTAAPLRAILLGCIFRSTKVFARDIFLNCHVNSRSIVCFASLKWRRVRFRHRRHFPGVLCTIQPSIRGLCFRFRHKRHSPGLLCTISGHSHA